MQPTKCYTHAKSVMYLMPSGDEVYQSPLALLIFVQRLLPKENPFSAYLIFVTNITNGVCGEKICHVEKIFHMTNCHVEKFLHMTNIQLEICLYMVNKEKNHVMWRNVE